MEEGTAWVRAALKSSKALQSITLLGRLFQSLVVQFSFQIFNAARQLSHIEAAPDKSGLVLLDSCVSRPRARVVVQPVSCRILTIGLKN